MSPRRLKSTILLAVIAVNALTLMSWTQVWFTARFVDDAQFAGSIAAAGDAAAGGLAALGLAGLALAGALAIAGPVFRVILGVLHSLIGVAVLASSLVAVSDPVSAVSAPVTELTGVSGADSVAELVASVSSTPWPWVGVGLGVVSIGIGIVIVVTSKVWPGSSRKYQTAGLVPAEDGTVDPAVDGPGATRASRDIRDTETNGPSAAGSADRRPDPVADWDSLSDGGDPTAR